MLLRQWSAFISYILFHYPFPCTDPFPSPRLIGVIMRTHQQSWLHPASPEHPPAHKGRREHIVYSPGKAAPSRSPGREAVFPVCQLPSLFSLPFQYFFFSQKAVASYIWRQPAFFPGNILSSLGISWEIFLWLKYNLVISPKPALKSYGWQTLSEASLFPSLIINKNNSLQLLTLK